MREKVGKSRNTVFFQWFGAPEGRKVGSLKRRVRSQLARWEMKNCTPLWREAHFQVKMYKTHQGFGPLLEVEMSKKCTPLWREAHFQVKMYKTHHASDHFWKLRCRKSARRCGAKHISKSKCTKHTILGPLLEVEISKKCTPLWREAHFQVKMYKTHHVRTTFGSWDVEKVHAVVARSTFRSQNVQNTTRSREALLEVGGSDVEKVNMYKTPHVRATFGGSDVASLLLHYITHYTTLHNTTTTTTQLHSTTLHYTKLHYTTLHYTTLHYTTLHYTTLHYLTLHFTTLHYTTLPLHYTTLHYTTLQLQLRLHNYTPLLHYTTLHYTTLHYTTLHYTPLHHTTLHYTTIHWMTLHHR